MKPCMSSQIGHQKSETMDLFYWRIKMVPSIRNSIPRERRSPFLICVTRPERSSGRKAANANLPFLRTRGGSPIFLFVYSLWQDILHGFRNFVCGIRFFVYTSVRGHSVGFLRKQQEVKHGKSPKGRISMVDPAGFEPASFAV